MDKSITVLVVEDILSARETVMHLLRALGFSSFLEAANGVEALEILGAHPVGLVISDWNMPKMNGLALLKEVRANTELKNIPFLFLTSKSEVEDIALASDSGVSAYLIKPVTIKAMSEALNGVFEGGFEQDFEAVRNEVGILCRDGRHDEADEALRRFECIYPSEYAKIRLQRVLIHMQRAEYAKAEAMLCEILSANFLFARGWEAMTALLSRQGKLEEALGAADKAVAISPNNPEYFVLRGSVHLHRKDLHEARKNFMTALNIDRKDDQIKQDIWNAYVDLDLVDEVERDFGSYIFSSLNCDTLNNMAVAYRRKGELKKAVEIYRTALDKEPDNPKILFNAAVAYVNRKQYAKAKTLLLHAVGNDPGFEKAKALLKQISDAFLSQGDDMSASAERA